MTVLVSAAALLGLLAGAAALVLLWVAGLVRDRRKWRGPGIIMHELICPAGELQDPQFADRRGFPYDDSTSGRVDSALMGRAPLHVPKTQHSVRHG